MKKIGALLVIFFVAAAGGWFFKVLRAPKPQAPADKRLVACDPARIRTVRLQRSGKPEKEKFVVLRRVDAASDKAFEARVFDQMEWEMVEPFHGEADVSMASRLVASACDTTDQVAVTAGREDTVAPVNQLVLEEDAPGGIRAHELHFGARLEGRQVRVWLGKPSDGRVYRVLPRVAGIVDAPAAAFQNKRVARTQPNNVMQATFEKRGRRVFSLDRDGAEWGISTGSGGRLRASDEAERYVNRVANLMALEVVPNVDGCEGRAVYRLTFSAVGGRQEMLSFSDSEKLQGRRGLLACSSLRKGAFLVHPDLLKYLDVEPGKLAATRTR